MTQIPGIYIPVEYDLARLRSEQGKVKQIITESAASIANSMNAALSGPQVKKGVNDLVSNLGNLSRASKTVGLDFNKLGVDLGALRSFTGMTEAQFAKLQSQMLRTQAAKVQEKSLADIAKAAGLTTGEIRALGAQMQLSEASIKKVVDSHTGLAKSTEFSMAKFRDMIITVGLYTVAFQGLTAVMGGVKAEFVRGLKAVEEFDLAVASSAAFITTFSEALKTTDIATVYEKAAGYAGRLNEKLEMIDANTIASGKNLQMMSETFIQHGILLDINNKRQVEGFTNIATALALVTAGQNQDVQVRQEINALLNDQVRATDRLPRLLQAIDPEIKSHLKTWKEEGTTIERVGELLKGFSSNTGTLNNQWISVGSTMETIHNRILRGAFRPMFEDLIKLAKAFNTALMDSEGHLTYIAIGIEHIIKGTYEFAKAAASSMAEAGKQSLASLPVFGQLATSIGLLSELEKKLRGIKDTGGNGINFGLVDGWKAEAKELARLQDMQDPWMVNALAAPKLGVTPDKPYVSKASDLNAAMQAEVELIKATEERKLAETRAGNDNLQQANQQAYELGLSSHSAYLDQKNALTQKSLKEELAAKQKELAAAENAAAKLSPITDKEGNARPDKDSKARADAEKRVEDAKRGVIEAENKLQQAEAEGAHAAKMAAKERADAYKQVEIQLLESQGKAVEAAQLMAEYDEESIERKRLIAEADAGIAEAQAALDAQRLMSANQIREAELDQLANKNEALLAIADIDGEYYKSLNIQIELLDIEIQRAELAGELPEKIALLRKERQELEAMQEPLSAFAKGWKDVVDHQKKASEQMYSLAQTTAKEMQSTFSDVFFDAMHGEFNSIGDAFESMTKRMLDSFLRMVADMAAQDLMSSLFGSSGKKDKADSTGWIDTAWDYVSDWWSETEWADGGYMAVNPGGGKINTGSGMGGEFIVNKRATAKFLPELEEINSYANGGVVGYAAGGRVGGGTNSRVFERFYDLVQAMQAAGVQSSATASGMIQMVSAIEQANGASRDRESAVAAVGMATAESNKSTNTAAESTQSFSTAIGGLTSTQAAGMEATLGYARESTLLSSALSSASTMAVSFAEKTAALALASSVAGPLLGTLATKIGLSTTAYKDHIASVESFTDSFFDSLLGFSESFDSMVGDAGLAIGDASAALQSAAEGAFGSLSDAGMDVSDASSALQSAAEGAFGSLSDASSVMGTTAADAFGSTTLGAEMTQTAATALTSSATALATSAGIVAGAVGGAIGQLSDYAASLRDNSILGDPDIDSSDRTPGDTPGGVFGDGGGSGGSGVGSGTSDGTASGYGGDQGGESDKYANGGIHWGGWRMVGERGPELEYTPPSRIFNNTDTNSILSGLQKQQSSGQPMVIHNHFYVDGKEIASSVMPAVDRHVANKAARGQLGQRTAY